MYILPLDSKRRQTGEVKYPVRSYTRADGTVVRAHERGIDVSTPEALSEALSRNGAWERLYAAVNREAPGALYGSDGDGEYYEAIVREELASAGEVTKQDLEVATARATQRVLNDLLGRQHDGDMYLSNEQRIGSMYESFLHNQANEITGDDFYAVVSNLEQRHTSGKWDETDTADLDQLNYMAQNYPDLMPEPARVEALRAATGGSKVPAFDPYGGDDD